MTIRIYNSLTKRKEDFVPLQGKTVKMYSCGVTVYDDCHIGHARSLYVFDVITRYLRYRGYDVQFVRNITDVDDKIINKAKELKISSDEVARRNIESYYEDMKLLNVKRADQEPRATENIPEMIRHIEGLIKKDAAYETGGDVYFKVRSFKDYGKLSGQSIEKMLEAVRIDFDPRKKDPLDFALWKKSADDEPGWESPWGRGRPGWHIECTCMSMKYLKSETFDIHAGGRDLIFPHHENEVAQAEALTEKTFAKYWIHHGLLTINGQKMAKSAGNFITIKKILQNYHPNELKFFFLSSHYASPIDYTVEKLDEARKHRKTFNEFFDMVHYWSLNQENKSTAAVEKEFVKLDEFSNNFQEAMDDDFNTPKALAVLFELRDFAAKSVSSGKKDIFEKAYVKLKEFFELLGLEVKSNFNTVESKFSEVRQLIQLRAQAKQQKNFAAADQLRQQFKEKFMLNAVDTIGGVTFIEESA
jgi:cysteinyl-tRNA synthetase